ncbi:MAG: hypothetical protein EOQ95_27485 [Mesorhizobium sp.]|nr:MAG: hypothetical protein EOQ95_27485 [Mesorhizobium sp.]
MTRHEKQQATACRLHKYLISFGKFWCPEADSNHRHADFQSNVDQPISRGCSETSVKPRSKNQSLSPSLSNPIEIAAAWYLANSNTCERPIIPALKCRFGLTAHEAVTAIREANGRHA